MVTQKYKDMLQEKISDPYIIRICDKERTGDWIRERFLITV